MSDSKNLRDLMFNRPNRKLFRLNFFFFIDLKHAIHAESIRIRTLEFGIRTPLGINLPPEKLGFYDQKTA